MRACETLIEEFEVLLDKCMENTEDTDSKGADGADSADDTDDVKAS
jgi:hypothetical protein